jgi:hypothetical protein
MRPGARASTRFPAISACGLALASLLASCGSAESGVKSVGESIPGSTTSTTAAATTTSTVAAVTTATSVATTAAPATTGAPTTSSTSPPATTAPDDDGVDGDAPCSTAAPLPAISAKASNVSTRMFDYDGDGANDDVATVYAIIDDGGIPVWFLRAETPEGGSEISLFMSDDAGAAAVVGMAQTDLSLGAGTGLEQELLVQVGTGAAGISVGVFFRGSAGCLEQFLDVSDGPATFAVRASVAQQAGLRCEGAAGSQFLVRLEASSADGIEHDTLDVKLERIGNHLIDDVSIPGHLTSPADDTTLATYGQIDCG